MVIVRLVRKIENAVICFKEKYMSLPPLERVLDGLLIAAVSLTMFFLALEHFGHASEEAIQILHRIDLVLAIVFFADLARTYQKSGHWTKFLRHHWLDVLAVIIVLVAFSSMMYPGVGRVSYLLKAEKLHKVTKFYHLKHGARIL